MSTLHTVGLVVTEQLQPSFDVRAVRVKLRCPLIGVKCIVDLVVARFVLRHRLAAVARGDFGPEVNLLECLGHTKPQQ